MNHPVACHCRATGTDDTCPSRWNGLIGATNCPRKRPHRGHSWHGHHPYRIAVIHMRCRGVTFKDWIRSFRAHA